MSPFYKNLLILAGAVLLAALAIAFAPAAPAPDWLALRAVL